jgi:glycosyltransferase involved in cell wall biosynthesis
MNTSSLISIIIPVYNVERYLCQCLDSIIIQTYTNWELILIDDGSEDSSSTICDYYVSKDNRIKVIHKSNTGVSDTRNRALDIAIGKYIIFMDADDYWFMETALEQLINIAEENDLDIIRGEYDIIDEQGDRYNRYLSPENQIKYINRLLTPYEFLKYAIHGEFFLWLCLFRRDIISSLRFECGQIFLEDMRFLSELMTKTIRCMYLPDLRFYAYRKNFTSVSLSMNPLKIKNSFDMCEFFYSLALKIEEREMKVLYQKMGIQMYYSTLETLATNEYYLNCRKYITDFKLNNKEKEICKWISEFKLRKYFLSIIYYVSPITGIYLFRMKHKLGWIRMFLKKIYKSICLYCYFY